MIAKLTEAERAAALAGLGLWEYRAERGAIARRFAFPDFVTAFGFMTSVALEAEKADHHPEWSNIYGTVDVLLTTHDCGGLSARDIALAHRIDGLAERSIRPAG